jgi:hypothetical protein
MTRTRSIFRNFDGILLLCLISWFIGYILLFTGEFTKPDFFSTHRLDFTKFYSMGKLIVSPDRFQLYDAQTQYAWLSKNCQMPKLEQNDRGRALMFAISSEQPPPFFLVFTPFGLFPIGIAFTLAMIAFGAITCVAAFALNRCRQVKLTLPQMLIILLGAFASGPAVSGLLQGHSNWLIAGIGGLFCATYLLDQDVLAGLMLACFVIKPQYGLFFAVPAIFERRWKVVGAAAVFTLVFLGICALVAGPHNILDYPSVIVRNDLSMGRSGEQLSLLVRTPPTRMVPLRAMLSVFLPNKLAMQISSAVLLLVLGLLGAMWVRVSKGLGDSRWAMSITVLASFVFGLHNLLYDCSLMIIPAVLTLPGPSLLSAFKHQPVSMKIWIIGLVLYPFVSSLIFLGIRSDRPEACLFFLYHLVLFLAATCQFLRKPVAAASEVQ